ncbi:MAG: hypothetical protein RL748_615 [Pseudomonadota bacterium]|jgi:membrane-bound lytic murein transglycosylase D
MRIQNLPRLVLATLLAASCANIASADETSSPLNPASSSTLNLKLSTIDAFTPPGAESSIGDTPLLEPGLKEIDVWARIRRGYAIPDLQNPLVSNQLNWYTSRPDYIQRTTVRASRYLYHVLEELEKRGMPTELALLPFIESAFNPEAYSSAKAAGMWQFIPSTGRDYNLTQNLFRDERRNVIASTDAALTYLQRLYGMFGDWQLALAAYNWGEGSVQRAIKRNQAAGLPIDFNSLSRLMPLETRNYVPKLQAVKNIIGNPAQYNLTLPKLENQPYFTSVAKTADIDLKVAAQLAEIPLDEFKALNPQFNRPVITGSETKILLPPENADKFKSNLAQWGRTLTTWTTHTITSAREKIEALASKFSTTPDVIREANHIPPKMRLRAGSTILVPKTPDSVASNTAPAADIADNATMSMEPDVADTRKVTHRVGRRDNLNGIASRYNVSVGQLKEWNGLQRDSISPGQSLTIHAPNRVARARAGRSTTLARHHTGKSNVVQAKFSKSKARRG